MARTTARASSPAHSRACRSRDLTPEQRDQPGLVAKACNCDPTYEAWVYSKRDEKKIRTLVPDAGRGEGLAHRRAQAGERQAAPRAVAADAPAGGRRVARRRPQRRDPEQARAALQAGRDPQLRAARFGCGCCPSSATGSSPTSTSPTCSSSRSSCRATGCSASTIRNTFVPLQAIYRRARRNGPRRGQPDGRPRLPTAGSRDRAATPEQAAELLEPLAGARAGALGDRVLRWPPPRRAPRRSVSATSTSTRTTISVERGWDDKDGPIDPEVARRPPPRLPARHAPAAP